MGNAMNKPESLEHARGVAELLALDNPALYINRELSLIQFNWRVLNQALDESPSTLGEPN